jgi:high affinity sulfate transporter 1
MVAPTSHGGGRFVPGLRVLRAYDKSWFPRDLLAGLSVAAVAVPIAIAYSQLAGVPPVHGLYAGILPLVAYAFLGTSRQLIMAPDAATCAIVAATVAPMAAGDTLRHISLAMSLAIIAGIFCIVGGLARLGFLTNFLARPILIGYLNGIALSIISGQLGKIAGVRIESSGFFHVLFEFFSKLGDAHLATLAVGAAAYALLRLLKVFAPAVPGPLVAVILGIAAAGAFDLQARGVALVGEIPAGLPRLMMPAIVSADLWPLSLGAIGLALISFNSAMVTARSFAVKNRYDIDADQEFIALGVSNIGAGLLQGFAVSGADSRTAVNDSVGGKSQVTGLVAAAVLVLVLLFLTGPLSLLPVAVLAAVLIVAGSSLFDLRSLEELRRINPPEFRLSLVALLGVVTVGVLPGVVIAIGLALLQLLAKASRPHDALLGRVPGLDGYNDVEGQVGAETDPDVLVYRFDAALLFFNADYFKSRVRIVVAQAPTRPRWFLLDAESMPLVDTTGAAVLEEVRQELADQGIVLAVARLKQLARNMLQRTGFEARVGSDLYFPTVRVGVESLTSRAASTSASPLV